jgi:hypothetical protein
VTTVAYARWVLEVDARQTALTYSKISGGGADECGCQGCLNFARARERVYPASVLKLFHELGVDFRREAEVTHQRGLPGHLHSYDGWFHCVGHLTTGRDGWREVAPRSYVPDVEEVDDSFALAFSNRYAPAHEAFEGLPLVQVFFLAKVPWLLPDAPPSLVAHTGMDLPNSGLQRAGCARR